MLYSAKDALDDWDTYAGRGKGRIPKDLLYGELERGIRKTGYPLLHFKDFCKRGMKSAAIDIESWELMIKDRSTRRQLVEEGLKHAENTRNMQKVEKRNIRKAMGTMALPNTIFKRETCNKDVIQKLVILVNRDVVQ